METATRKIAESEVGPDGADTAQLSLANGRRYGTDHSKKSQYEGLDGSRASQAGDDLLEERCRSHQPHQEKSGTWPTTGKG